MTEEELIAETDWRQGQDMSQRLKPGNFNIYQKLQQSETMKNKKL